MRRRKILETSYWNNTGTHQKKLDILNEVLPVSGLTSQPIYDFFITVQNLYYDYYNNGLCNWESKLPEVVDVVYDLSLVIDKESEVSDKNKDVHKNIGKIVFLAKIYFNNLLTKFRELEFQAKEETRPDYEIQDEWDAVIEEMQQPIENFLDAAIVLADSYYTYNLNQKIQIELGL